MENDKKNIKKPTNAKNTTVEKAKIIKKNQKY